MLKRHGLATRRPRREGRARRPPAPRARATGHMCFLTWRGGGAELGRTAPVVVEQSPAAAASPRPPRRACRRQRAGTRGAKRLASRCAPCAALAQPDKSYVRMRSGRRMSRTSGSGPPSYPPRVNPGTDSGISDRGTAARGLGAARERHLGQSPPAEAARKGRRSGEDHAEDEVATRPAARGCARAGGAPGRLAHDASAKVRRRALWSTLFCKKMSRGCACARKNLGSLSARRYERGLLS